MSTRKRSTQPRFSRWLSAVLVAALIGGASAFGITPAFADEVPTPAPSSSTSGTESGAAADSTTPADAEGAPSEGESEAPAAPSEEAPSEEVPVEGAPVEGAPADDVAGATPVGPAAPVAAAAAVPAVTVTPAPHSGGKVTITGTGFATGSAGVYLALGPAGLPGFYLGASQMIASETTWVAVGNAVGESAAGKTAPMNADGSFEVTVTVPAAADGTSFALYTSKGHGQGMGDKSQDTTTAVVFAPAPAPAITITPAPYGGGKVTISGTGFATGTAGIYLGLGPAGLPGFYFGASQMIASETTWVAVGNPVGDSAAGNTAPMNADGSFEVTVTVPTPTATASSFAVYTSKGHGQGMGDKSQDTTTAVTFAEAPVPTIVVSKTSNIDPAGEYVTVTGTGFLPRPETIGVRPPLDGKFTGAYVIFGKFADVWKPSASAPSTARVASDTKWALHKDDHALVGGAARGAIELKADGSFETELFVKQDFKGSDGLGNFGVYSYAGGGAVSTAFESYTPIAFTVPVVNTTTTIASSTRGPVALGASVTLTATVAPANASGSVQFLSSGAPIGAPVAVNSKGAASTSTTLATAGTAALSARFVPAPGSAFGGSTSASINITVAAPPAVPGGVLSWGVDSGFRNYVTGPIASGSIGLSGGATSLGAAYHFGQGAASFDHANGTGSASYVGTVRFSGHNGELDLSFANPTVRVDSASSGALLVTVNGRTVTLATLNLAAASRSTSDGATRFADAPAVLTGEGAAAFNGFYSAGRLLSPVSFTVGSASSAPAGASGTVSTASAVTSTVKPIPATPPATTGIDIAPDVLKQLLAGETVTISVGGFKPNETGIRVIIYSTPTVLAENLTADASGVVSWTGSLPVGLTGKHTLTVQGSVDKGIVLDIPTAAKPGFCPVEGAELSWGLKERFRDYVLGGIANGTIELAGGATEIEGGFAWASGTGEYNAETNRGLVSFVGSVRFTGHGGVLDTTIANPRIEVESADRAYLLLDVTGTTQQGVPVNAQGVRFAEITLSGAAAVEGGTLVVTNATAVLTEQGTASFGTYPAGEELDPVSFSIPLPADCAVTVAAVDEKPVAAAASTDVTSAPGADTGWILWLVGGVLLLGVAATAVVLVLRRRGAPAAE